MPEFIGKLVRRLIVPGVNLRIPRDKGMSSRYIDFKNRVVACRYREWQKYMRNEDDVPQNLIKMFPRIMLMTKNQRARCIQSLIGMKLLSEVNFRPQNLKEIRSIFEGLYMFGKFFAVEINSNGPCIIVLNFRCNADGKVMMKAERHNRLNGLIDESCDHEVMLNRKLARHTIDLSFKSEKSIFPKTGRLFYTKGISLPLEESFNLPSYHSVRFYRATEGQEPKSQEPDKKRRQIE